MARHVSMDEARTHLPELVEAVKNGEVVLIAEKDQPVAELVPVTPEKNRPRFGSARGLVEMAEDFNAPLADFADTMR